MNMRERRIGQDGPMVSAIGLGCMGMSEFYGPSDEERSIEVIHRALELGVNFLDTADMYGSGHNEKLVGRAIADRRDRVFLATKFAVQRGEGGAFVGVSGRPEYVKEACEASLRRLGIDTIDLYYQHRVDPEVPVEDTVGAMADLVQQGKVRYLGLSEAAPETIRRAAKVHPIAALQTEYSLWSRDPEDALLDTCADLGITFVAYSPLGRGFLTGRFRSPDDFDETDFRRHSPRFQGENFRKNLELVDRVKDIAKKYHRSPAQLALAWLLAKRHYVIPIPGTRSVDRLEENAAAVGFELSPEDIAAIDEAAPKDAVAGTRYDENGMRLVNG